MVVANSYWYVMAAGTSLYLIPVGPLCMPHHAIIIELFLPTLRGVNFALKLVSP